MDTAGPGHKPGFAGRYLKQGQARKNQSRNPLEDVVKTRLSGQLMKGERRGEERVRAAFRDAHDNP